jgi:uncharacterized protein (TIGR00162 family)
MEKTTVNVFSKPKLKAPVLIEGLPGMGYVGKLAAEHLREELHTKKFAELCSPHFPHHVVVEANGTLRPLRNEFYFARTDGKDIVLLVGDVQPISPEGHYEVVESILDVAEQFSVKRLFTLGGYATGKYSRTKSRVVGVGDPALLKELRSHGVTVEGGGGPIIGAAGLLLGLGKLRGMRGACLLGETHGMVVDYRAARAVLDVLVGVLGIKVGMSALEHRARETERMLDRVRGEMELRMRKERRREEEEAWYIG